MMNLINFVIRVATCIKCAIYDIATEDEVLCVLDKWFTWDIVTGPLRTRLIDHITNIWRVIE